MNMIIPSITTTNTTIQASNLKLFRWLLFYFLMELIHFLREDRILESLSSQTKILAVRQTRSLPHLMGDRPPRLWWRLKQLRRLQALKSFVTHLNGSMIQILNVLMGWQVAPSRVVELWFCGIPIWKHIFQRLFYNSDKCKLKSCSRRFVTTTLTCECDETGCNWYSDTSRNSKILNEKGPKCIRQIKKGILEESCAKVSFSILFLMLIGY